MPEPLQILPLDKLPAGPRRDLTEEIFVVYKDAGRPPLRTIKTALQHSRHGSSTETIRRTLIGIGRRPPGWQTVRAIYVWLCEEAEIDPARPHPTVETSLIRHLRDLWSHAYEAASAPIEVERKPEPPELLSGTGNLHVFPVSPNLVDQATVGRRSQAAPSEKSKAREAVASQHSAEVTEPPDTWQQVGPEREDADLNLESERGVEAADATSSVNAMDPEGAAAALNQMDPDRAAAILNQMDPVQATRIRQLWYAVQGDAAAPRAVSGDAGLAASIAPEVVARGIGKVALRDAGLELFRDVATGIPDVQLREFAADTAGEAMFMLEGADGARVLVDALAPDQDALTHEPVADMPAHWAVLFLANRSDQVRFDLNTERPSAAFVYRKASKFQRKSFRDLLLTMLRESQHLLAGAAEG